MTRLIILGVLLELVGLLCWASICSGPYPSRDTPRQIDWQTVQHDSTVGVAVITGLVFTLVLSVVCWF